MVWSLFGREYAGRRNAVTCPGCGRYRRNIHRHRRHVGRRRPAREQGLDHSGRTEPGRGRGCRRLAQGIGRSGPNVEEVLHGTTVGSNTILQRSGARTGLITTRGFRDVLEIGRIRMPDMFDLTWDKPKPLVPRRHRLEVAERIAADGSVVEPLERGERDRGRRAARRRGHRGGRHLPHQQLPQPRARAAHRGDPARSDSPDLLVTASYARAARAQGIRAHQHDGGERLSAARHAQLSAAASKRGCAPSASRRRSG